MSSIKKIKKNIKVDQKIIRLVSFIERPMPTEQEVKNLKEW